MHQSFYAKGLRASLLALCIGSTHAAIADTPARSISLSAQPLDQAILSLAEQTGLNIGGDASLLQGKSAPALSGEYTGAEALDALLAGTGIRYEFTTDTSVILVLDTRESAASSLPPVRVSAGTIVEAQTTVTLDKAALEQIEPLDLKDVFKKEASVSVGGAIPANQKLYVRGVEETAMAVNIDGARQNNKVFHHSATTLIDPTLLKAVSVSAGISPADDGPGAIGGSVNYETIDVADYLSPADNFGGFVNADYRSNGNIYDLGGALMAQSNGFEVLGFLKNASGDDYEDGDGDTIPYSAPALTSGLAKVAYGTEALGRFELSYENVNDDALRPYRANFLGLTAGRPTPAARNYALDRENLVFSYDRERGEGLWNPSVTIADSQTEVETNEGALADPSVRYIYTGTAGSTSATLQNVFYTGFANISAGADYYDDETKFQYEGDPDLRETATNTGLFVQLRQEVSTLLQLSYGLRYDSQDFTGVDGTTQSESGVSGNLFGELFVNEHLSFNAGAAQVWGGTALAENFILNGAWDYSAGVPAVESSNYTAGLKSFYEGFSFEANIFQTDIENGRTPSWGGGPSLVADFEMKGYDLLVGYATERGDITVKYADIESYKDGEAASSYDGNYFTAPLGQIITVDASLYFADAQYQLGLTSETALENDATSEAGRAQEGYTVINLFLQYQALDNLSLRLVVDNALNEQYTDRASYGQEFETVIPFYEPGRSVGLNARFQF